MPLDLLLRAYSTVLYFAIALEDWPAFAEWTVFTSRFIHGMDEAFLPRKGEIAKVYKRLAESPW